MRTTLNIDEDVLQAARELAAMRHVTVGQMVSELARRGLQPDADEVPTRNDVQLLPRRPGSATVTAEAVHRILDEE